jgi:hypothetical protein
MPLRHNLKLLSRKLTQAFRVMMKKAQRLCTSALEISCDAKCPVLRELESSSEKVI